MIKMTSAQYSSLISVYNSSEKEQAALMPAKKSGSDIIPYSIICDDKLKFHSTKDSIRFNMFRIRKELARAKARDGADAAIIFHTHPGGHYVGLSRMDEFGLRQMLLFVKIPGVETFLGVISGPDIAVWNCNGLKTRRLDVAVDGKIKKTTVPASYKELMGK